MVHNLEDEWESFLNGEEYEHENQNEKNSKNSFIYSWHRADDLKNLGKGFVYENVLDMKSVK